MSKVTIVERTKGKSILCPECNNHEWYADWDKVKGEFCLRLTCTNCDYMHFVKV